MMDRAKRARRRVMLEHREVEHPQECEHATRNERESASDILTHPVEGSAGHSIAAGGQEDQVAFSHSQRLDPRRTDKLCGRTFETVGPALETYEPTGASGFGDGLQLVHLLARERGTTGDAESANTAT